MTTEEMGRGERITDLESRMQTVEVGLASAVVLLFRQDASMTSEQEAMVGRLLAKAVIKIGEQLAPKEGAQ